MTALATSATIDQTLTPTDRLLNAALLVAPVTYLAADSIYAVRGWDDPTAGVIHVIGAIAYGLLVLRVALWLAPESGLKAWLILTGLIGLAGNVAYGFDTIHMSLGDTALVDQSGAANLIKPLGLFFPLSLVLIAVAIAKLGHRWQGAIALLAAVAWPVAHIANIASLAIVVNVALLIALGSLVWAAHDIRESAGQRP